MLLYHACYFEILSGIMSEAMLAQQTQNICGDEYSESMLNICARLYLICVRRATPHLQVRGSVDGGVS